MTSIETIVVDVYDFGGYFVVVDSGQPEDPLAAGMGESLADAVQDVQDTPWQSAEWLGGQINVRDLIRVMDSDGADNYGNYTQSYHEVAEYDDRIVELRPGATTSHESAQEWYDAYGAYVPEPDQEGSQQIEVQAIEYDWLDGSDDDVAQLLANDGIAGQIAIDLITLARDVRRAAEEIEDILDQAVEAYNDDDLVGVIDALTSAASAESEHGDTPATDFLADQLLTYL